MKTKERSIAGFINVKKGENNSQKVSTCARDGDVMEGPGRLDSILASSKRERIKDYVDRKEERVHGRNRKADGRLSTGDTPQRTKHKNQHTTAFSKISSTSYESQRCFDLV